MDIKQFAWDVVDSNSWLIKEDNHGLLIDAVENERLYNEIRSLADLTIILTHSHFDHIIGLNTIREFRPDAKVISTSLCSCNITNRYRNMSSSASAFMAFYDGGKKKDALIDPFVCAPANESFEGKTDFIWNGHQVGLYSVYGHTADGLIVVVDNRLFSGDTLLHVPTVTRFPTGDKKRFIGEDLPLLFSLRAELVYPGHGDVIFDTESRIRDMIKQSE